jgi:hypothetical protein
MQSQTRFEQVRISQLLSTYSPQDPPRMSLDFGDYLSILWRLDQCASQPNRVRYYRRCSASLADALSFKNHALHRLVEMTPPGNIYLQLPNLPYRLGGHLVDAKDRKAAIAQLIAMRDHIFSLGTYQEKWGVSWPGSGILDTDVRERVFAVLFTALQGQYANFARLLLVIDIVLANLLLGVATNEEVTLPELVGQFGYPNPAATTVQKEFLAEEERGRT